MCVCGGVLLAHGGRGCLHTWGCFDCTWGGVFCLHMGGVLLHIGGCFVLMHICVVTGHSASWGQKRAWDILEVELQMILNDHIGARNLTCILWKSSQYLNHWAISPDPWVDFWWSIFIVSLTEFGITWETCLCGCSHRSLTEEGSFTLNEDDITPRNRIPD